MAVPKHTRGQAVRSVFFPFPPATLFLPRTGDLKLLLPPHCPKKVLPALATTWRAGAHWFSYSRLHLTTVADINEIPSLPGRIPTFTAQCLPKTGTERLTPNSFPQEPVIYLQEHCLFYTLFLKPVSPWRLPQPFPPALCHLSSFRRHLID